MRPNIKEMRMKYYEAIRTNHSRHYRLRAFPVHFDSVRRRWWLRVLRLAQQLVEQLQFFEFIQQQFPVQLFQQQLQLIQFKFL